MWLFASRKVRSATRARSRRLTCRPRVERLEERCVPSSSPLDPAFGSGGIATSAVTANLFPYSMALQADGKIIAAGTSEQPDASTGFPQYEFALARYNINGSLDTSFGSAGKVLTAFGDSAPYGSNVDAEINGMALQSDGKIVVAGYFTITGS